MLVATSGTAGVILAHFYYAGGAWAVFPVMGGALWYVFARIDRSRATGTAKVLKIVTALSAVALSPALLSGPVSPFVAATAYGWNSDLAFGGPKVLSLGIAVGSFVIVDVIDRVIRRLRLSQESN
jgi:hypothetical protein